MNRSRFRVNLLLLQLFEKLLLERPEPPYGLLLMQELETSNGAVYGMLHKLEAAGYVSSVLEEIDERAAGRRKRRYWSLTAEGRAFAESEMRRASQLYVSTFQLSQGAVPSAPY